MQKDKFSGNTVALLAGLVLAGGKSTRMGRDKGMMDWHGKAQRYYLADLLADDCVEVFISCRTDQTEHITTAGYKALPDNAEPKAQYGAILSAMKAYPDYAWLVVACDLPLIDTAALKYLIDKRDPDKLATAYRNTESGLPEPLAAIWEPDAKEMLLQKFAAGIDCPKKALLRSEGKVKLVDPPDSKAVMNVNTPESAMAARELIESYAD